MSKCICSFVSLLGLGATFVFTATNSAPMISPNLAVTSQVDDENVQDEDNRTLKLEKVPSEGRRAIRQAAGDHKITSVSLKRDWDATVYEASWQIDGREHEITVTADGTVVEHNSEIKMSDVPHPVQATIAQLFSKRTKMTVEKKTILVYEVEAMIHGKEKTVLLSATGLPIEIEATQGNDDDGGNADGDTDEHGGADADEDGDTDRDHADYDEDNDHDGSANGDN